MFRTLSRGQLLFDLLVPALLLLVLVLPYSLFGSNVFVLVGMCASLVFWRLNTGLSLAIAWVTSALELALGLTPDPSNLAIFIVLYATAAYGSPVVKWLGFASTFLGASSIALYIIVLPAARGEFPVAADDLTLSTSIAFLSFLGLFLLSWTFGLLVKTFSTARDSRRAQAVAEIEQQRARQDVMVEQERTRIARDMHDVVAHSLAVVIAQADGARYARAADPAAADDALDTIASTARDALGDVRELLAQLRHSQSAGPQPVLDDLDRLLDQLRGSGLDIRHRVGGSAGTLGTAQQLAVYRIVQEALTNALRHGDTTRPVELEVQWHAESVDVRISSETTAPVPAPIRAGHGLAGMRERALIAGGHLDIETVGDRFTVLASIPRVSGQTGGIDLSRPGADQSTSTTTYTDLTPPAPIRQEPVS